MRTRPIILSKTCPVCGARSKAEARLPLPVNMPTLEFNLDDLGALVAKQSLSLLLALVELLPYKTFSCAKCGSEFRLESRSARELVGTMLSSLQPILPKTQPGKARPRGTLRPAPGQATPASLATQDWEEAESLDSLFDYSTDGKAQGPV